LLEQSAPWLNKLRIIFRTKTGVSKEKRYVFKFAHVIRIPSQNPLSNHELCLSSENGGFVRNMQNRQAPVSHGYTAKVQAVLNLAECGVGRQSLLARQSGFYSEPGDVQVDEFAHIGKHVEGLDVVCVEIVYLGHFLVLT